MFADPQTDAWIEVYRCPRARAGHEHALVLTALDIDHSLAREEDTYILRVPPAQAPRAREELAQYQAENQDWPPAPAPPPSRVSSGLHGALGYCTLLLAISALERYRTFSLDWWEAGRGNGELIRQGEWWRSLTALTLHADEAHLLGNLLFGSLFISLLCRELGTGPAWLSILLAGALANYLNAWWHPLPHAFVGASTGVFAALGILVVLQLQRAPSSRSLRHWAPLIIGAVFLGFLGTAGERTDVLAHVAGMVTGMAAGVLWNFWAGQRPLSRPWQQALAWAVLGLMALAWHLAHQRI